MKHSFQVFACSPWLKRLGLYVCFFLLTIGAAWAQGQTIKGTVVDSNGETVIGASVLQKGTTNGTITDIDGNFIINNVPANATIEVSFVGYKTQTIPLNGQSSLKIVLKEDNEILDEVVVIGYGVQKKADLTGSVANVSADKLNTQSNANIGQALQGKIAGVDIVSQGGLPGQGTRIMVRGIGTLNNAAPLYTRSQWCSHRHHQERYGYRRKTNYRPIR